MTGCNLKHLLQSGPTLVSAALFPHSRMSTAPRSALVKDFLKSQAVGSSSCSELCCSGSCPFDGGMIGHEQQTHSPNLYEAEVGQIRHLALIHLCKTAWDEPLTNRSPAYTLNLVVIIFC